MSPVRTLLLAFPGLCSLLLVQAFAVENVPGPAPNSNAEYRQLRSLSLSGGEAVSVNGLVIRRDVGTFQLRSGTICFVAPVQGKVTGAVFIGDGSFTLDPPLASEKQLLSLLSKEKDFHENFSQLVLRFTDTTYQEIKKTSSPSSGGCDPGPLRDSQDAMRHNHMLKWNLEARLLQDVLSPEPGAFFLAFVHGKKYNSKEIFVVDPHGAPSLIMRVVPEELEFLTYDENKLGVWTALHLAEEYKNGTATGSQNNSIVHIEHQQLDTTIEKSANLIGKSTTTFVALSFIQEDKNDDADFAVILSKPLAPGEKYTITTTYVGKDAVSNEGNGNYFPVARDDWYPNNVSASLGEYTAYDMTFRVPKDLTVAATGTLVSDNRDGGQRVTVWKTEVPQTVAGFNLGKFKVEEAKLTKPEYLIQSFANEELPDSARGLSRCWLRGKSPLGCIQTILARFPTRGWP